MGTDNFDTPIVSESLKCLKIEKIFQSLTMDSLSSGCSEAVKELLPAVAAVVGAAVADAAARPLHWVYNAQVIKDLMKESQNLEFWPENKSPFYSLPTGARSGYNHALMVGLKSFIDSHGCLDIEVYKKNLKNAFGEGSDWQEALAQRKEAYSPSVRLAWKQEPIPGPWLHGAVIAFLETGTGNPDNTEMDGFLLSLPHLLFNAKKAEVMEECLSIAKLLSGNKKYPTLQALLILELFQNKEITEDFVDTLDRNEAPIVQEVFDYLEEDNVKCTHMYGNNCHLPGSLQGALHSYLKHVQDTSGNICSEEKFKTAVRATIQGGGCNCSRANYLGALVGLKEGPGAIPQSWLDKVTGAQEILELAFKAAEVATKDK